MSQLSLQYILFDTPFVLTLLQLLGKPIVFIFDFIVLMLKLVHLLREYFQLFILLLGFRLDCSLLRTVLGESCIFALHLPELAQEFDLLPLSMGQLTRQEFQLLLILVVLCRHFRVLYPNGF
jgi:hypothetical protein